MLIMCGTTLHRAMHTRGPTLESQDSFGSPLSRLDVKEPGGSDLAPFVPANRGQRPPNPTHRWLGDVLGNPEWT